MFSSLVQLCFHVPLSGPAVFVFRPLVLLCLHVPPTGPAVFTCSDLWSSCVYMFRQMVPLSLHVPLSGPVVFTCFAHWSRCVYMFCPLWSRCVYAVFTCFAHWSRCVYMFHPLVLYVPLTGPTVLILIFRTLVPRSMSFARLWGVCLAIFMWIFILCLNFFRRRRYCSCCWKNLANSYNTLHSLNRLYSQDIYITLHWSIQYYAQSPLSLPNHCELCLSYFISLPATLAPVGRRKQALKIFKISSMYMRKLERYQSSGQS